MLLLPRPTHTPVVMCFSWCQKVFWQTGSYCLKQKWRLEYMILTYLYSSRGWVNHLTVSISPHSWSSRSLPAWGRCTSTLQCCPVGWPDRLPAPGRTRGCPQPASAARTGGEKHLRRRGDQHSVSKREPQFDASTIMQKRSRCVCETII